jgi:hypothetical protein
MMSKLESPSKLTIKVHFRQVNIMAVIIHRQLLLHLIIRFLTFFIAKYIGSLLERSRLNKLLTYFEFLDLELVIIL